ncbi:MAG: integration host factor subunit beta [Nitrospirae bacterium]|nr:integration host factor subunit beta [Nitrospirota bacterium]
MTKYDLVRLLMKECALSYRNSERVVNYLFDAITESLAEESRVELRGLGTFSVRRYDAYTGRNPRTGAKISVRPKKLPYFKMGRELKRMINSEPPEGEGNQT